MPKKKQYLINIDGSTTKTGVSIFNIDTKELLSYNAIMPGDLAKSTKKMNKAEKAKIKKANMDYRINTMITEINKILKEYKPTSILMEDTYGGKDMYAYKKLCHLQGLVLSYSLTSKATLQFKSPSTWRAEIGIPTTINKVRLKRAELKALSIKFVKDTYGLDVCEDEAEAICLGVSYFV